jgi:hypothetical protein
MCDSGRTCRNPIAWTTRRRLAPGKVNPVGSSASPSETAAWTTAPRGLPRQPVSIATDAIPSSATTFVDGTPCTQGCDLAPTYCLCGDGTLTEAGCGQTCAAACDSHNGCLAAGLFDARSQLCLCSTSTVTNCAYPNRGNIGACTEKGWRTWLMMGQGTGRPGIGSSPYSLARGASRYPARRSPRAWRDSTPRSRTEMSRRHGLQLRRCLRRFVFRVTRLGGPLASLEQGVPLVEGSAGQGFDVNLHQVLVTRSPPDTAGGPHRRPCLRGGVKRSVGFNHAEPTGGHVALHRDVPGTGSVSAPGLIRT